MCASARIAKQGGFILSFLMSAPANLKAAIQRSIGDQFQAISWHKLTFPLASHEPVKAAVDIILLAFDMDERAGHPNGFAIFSGWDFGKDDESTSFVLYFSPVSSLFCADALPKSLTRCKKPDRDGLGLAYASLQYRHSWDLLR